MKVINTSYYALPQYETEGAVGMDVRAHLDNKVTIESLGIAIIPTGLYVEVPEGFELQVRSRSGLAAKYSVSVCNSPGCIDPDYRGEIKVILLNSSKNEYIVNPGERVAQLILSPIKKFTWESVEVLTETVRGEGGLGSSGKH
jgi:dUTP pyrophosphatase